MWPEFKDPKLLLPYPCEPELLLLVKASPWTPLGPCLQDRLQSAKDFICLFTGLSNPLPTCLPSALPHIP